MGSIVSINHRPRTWPASDSGRVLKPEYGGEALMLVTYGTLDDYPEGACELKTLMRKSIYDRAVRGDLRVANGCPADACLRLENRDGSPFPALASSVY